MQAILESWHWICLLLIHPESSQVCGDLIVIMEMIIVVSVGQMLTSAYFISSGGLDKNAVVFYRDTEQVRLEFKLWLTILSGNEFLTFCYES